MPIFDPTSQQSDSNLQIEVPGGIEVLQGSFARSGDDLCVTCRDGNEIQVDGYFAGDVAADLVTGGAVVPARMVQALTRTEPEGVDALVGGDGSDSLIGDDGQVDHLAALRQHKQDNEGSASSEPVAEIGEYEGVVTITRADGSRVTAEVGTPLYQDDVIATSGEGSVGVSFVDGMSFSLGENAKLLLDEFSYEPQSGDGGGLLSVLQGGFSFVSGEAAHSGLDALMIETPTMTIGVRGTKVAAQAGAEGETSKIALMAEQDGTIGKIMVSTDAGQELLEEPNKMVEVTSRFEPPSPQTTITTAELVETFGVSLSALPAIEIHDLPPAPDDPDYAPTDRGGADQGRSNAGERPAVDAPAEADAVEAAEEAGEEAGEGAAEDAASDDAAAEAVPDESVDARLAQAESGELQETIDTEALLGERLEAVADSGGGRAESTESTLQNGALGAADSVALPTAASPRAEAATAAVATPVTSPAADDGGPGAGSGGGGGGGGTPPGNQAPTLASAVGAQGATEDVAFNVDLSGNFSDPDAGDVLTYSANLSGGGALPSWLSINASTGVLSGTALNGDVGGLTVEVTATDGGGLSTATTFALTVGNSNDAPVVATPIGAAAPNQGQAYSYDASVNFTDDDLVHGDSLTFTADLTDSSPLPGWLSINPTTGVLSGTPGAGDVGTPWNVRVTATDGSGSSAQTSFVLTVNNVNDAPVLDNSGAPALSAIVEDTAAPAGDTVGAIVVDGSITDPDGGAVEAIAVTSVDDTNGTWEYSTDGGTTFNAIGAVSDNSALLLDAAAVVRFVPNADYNGTATFGYKAWDQSSGSNGQTGVDTTAGTAFSAASEAASISVTAVADAPVLDTSGVPTLSAIAEDTAVPAGDTVASIVVDGSITDADGAVAEAIAVTLVDDTNGTWEYSTDGGTTFNAIGAVSDNSALLLDGAALVRFVPNADYNGTATFGYKAWDQSSGSNGQSAVDTTAGTAFSTASETASITVTAVADAPDLNSAASATLTAIAEDTAAPAGDTVASIVVDGSITDADGAIAEAIAVTGIDNTNGTWEYSTDGGTTFNAIGAVSDNSALLLDGAAMVRFVPNADFHGGAAFDFKAWDQSVGSNGQTGVDTTAGVAFSADTASASIGVTPVADAPVLDTAGAPTLTSVVENTAAPVGNSVASIVIDGSVTDVDGPVAEAIAVTGVDNSNGTWEYSTDGGTSFNAVGAVSDNAALLLDGAAVIRFVPNASYNGSATFDFKAWDQSSGSSGQGGVDTTVGMAFSAATETASITIDNVNNAPVLSIAGSPKLAAIAEDTAAPAGNSVAEIVIDGSITDADGAVEAIAVTSVDNSNGTWEFSTDGGTNFNSINTVSDSSALLLNDTAMIRFIPDANFDGTATFSFKAWDQSTGSNGQSGVDTTVGTAFSSATETGSIMITPDDSAGSLDLGSGSEVLVNSTTANAQTNPSVGALEGGGYVVAWTSNQQDGSNEGVYAQRYDANGAAVGGEFQVNSETSNSQDDPSVVGLSGGAFVVVWSSRNQDGHNTGVFGQRYDVNGDPAGSEFQVNTETFNKQEDVDVAALTGGGFVVTWESQNQDGSSRGVYGQRYDASGNTAGSEFQVNTATSDAQEHSSVAALQDGGFFVVWQSYIGGSYGYGAYGQRYDASGAAVGGEVTINTEFSDDQTDPVIATLDSGDFVVAWRSANQDGDSGGIYAQRFDASGNKVEFELQVNSTTAGDQSEPSITALSDGGFLIAWQSAGQDGSGNGIYAQRYSADGDTVGGEVLLNITTANNEQDVDLATLSSGDVVAAWESDAQDGGGAGVYARHFDSATASVTVNAPVKVGASVLDFGGSNSTVNVGDPGSDSDDLDPGTGDFTVEAWFHYEGANGTQTIVSKGNESLLSEGYGIFLDGDALVVRASGGTIFASDVGAQSITMPTEHGWYHVAMVIDQGAGLSGSSVTGYLNGSNTGWNDGHGSSPDKTFTTAFEGIENSADFLVGAVDTGSGQGNFFDGEIADVRVWNKARGEAEIQADMSRTLNGTEDNLVANWRLDDGAGTTAANQVAGGTAGTLAGGPSWAATSSYNMAMDGELDGRVTATDLEGDTLSFSVSGAAANGTASIDSDSGAWEYTPDASYTGTDSFSYQISDGNGGTDTVSISVQVS